MFVVIATKPSAERSYYFDLADFLCFSGTRGACWYSTRPLELTQ